MACLGYLTYSGLFEIKKKMSKKTIERHSHFIKVLYVQTLIHMLGFSIPAMMFLCLPLFKIQIEGSLNFCIVLVVLSNILSPAYVFYNISTYKDAIRSIFIAPWKEKISTNTVNVRSQSSQGG